MVGMDDNCYQQKHDTVYVLFLMYCRVFNNFTQATLRLISELTRTKQLFGEHKHRKLCCCRSSCTCSVHTATAWRRRWIFWLKTRWQSCQSFLSVRETPEGSCGLETVSRASVDVLGPCWSTLIPSAYAYTYASMCLYACPLLCTVCLKH